LNIAKLRIHIAPVGFETDRVVISAKKTKADKVWLLVHDNPSEDKATPFIEKIIKHLKKEKIQVELFRVNRTDLFAIIKALKLIKDYGKKMPKKMLAELAEKNNLIVVNAQKKNFELACFASLDKNIIQPLQDQWMFIEVEKIGRTRYVKITEAGKNAAEFLV